MKERLTWAQIQERYPNQWVGLIDVKRKEDNSAVESAVVMYTDKSKDELACMQIHDSTHSLYSCFTTPDSIFQLGHWASNGFDGGQKVIYFARVMT